MSYADEILRHYIANWGARLARRTTTEGSFQDLPEDFCILEFPPHDQRTLWTYATCGMSAGLEDKGLELHLFSPHRADGLVTLLYAVAHYHRTGATLGLHHSVRFGTPWLEESQCTCGYIALPYLDGPSLEKCAIEAQSVSFLWLIPITPEELALKTARGTEALEELLESANFDYANPYRVSTI